jgi:hypothetical protein
VAALRRASLPERDPVPAPTGAQIEAAERALGITLPPSFRYFLAHAGALRLDFWETLWVGGPALGWRDLVRVNQRERQRGLPARLVAFHQNGGGDYACFDTRRARADGECPVVSWDHARSPEEDLEELHDAAEDFACWLLDQVESEAGGA